MSLAQTKLLTSELGRSALTLVMKGLARELYYTDEMLCRWSAKFSRRSQGYPCVMHQLMLVERRIHLIENLCLDEPVKNKVYELRVALLFQASLVR